MRLRMLRQGSELGGLWPVTAFLIAAALLLAFLWIAEGVDAGEFGHFDERLLLAFRTAAGEPAGGRMVAEAARDVSALGGNVVLGLLVAAAAGYLLLAGRRATALFVLVAVLGGLGLSSLLKIGYARPRPDLVPHAAEVFTSSFPSGHATLSAIVYLTLAVILARAQASRRLRVYFAAVAILLAVAVGASRVYLGVHFPSDVLAGWCIGASWALLCSAAAVWLQHHHRLEKPATLPPPER